jgi:glycosyltransferase involved in cell wall biosynthesis
VSYPGVPVVNVFDYYIQARYGDLWDDDGTVLPPEYLQWRRSANAMDLLDLENGVTPWTFTTWQRDRYPAEYRDDFVVLHDGVAVPEGRVDRSRSRTVLGRTLPPGTRLVTFAAGSLDRLRGFDRFLELAARLLRERNDVVAVALGAPTVDRMLDVRYHGQDHAARIVAARPPADPGRLWLPGRVTPGQAAEVLAASDLHVAPGRAYPVSRSLLEAMAAGAPVLAWDAEPVREVIGPDINGVLVLAGEPEAAFEAARRILDSADLAAMLGNAAQAMVRERYDREVTRPRLAAWFSGLAASGRGAGGGVEP